MSFTIFFYIFLATAVVSFYVSLLAWKRKKVHAAFELSQLMFFVGFYSFFIAFEAASNTASGKILFSKLAYPGAVTVPVLYYIFIMYYTGHENIVSRKNKLLLFILPAITLILTLTNEFHHLIWSGFSPIFSKTNLMVYYHGPWFFYGYMAYDYILLLVASVSLFNFILKHRTFFRRQGWNLLIAGICPWLAGIIYVTSNPIPGFDIAPVFTGMSGVLMIYAILKTNFLDLVPIARETLVDTLKDGIIVLDAKNRVQDINEAACVYLGIQDKQKIIGLSVESCGIYSDRVLNAVISCESIEAFETLDEGESKIFSILKQEITKEAGSRLVVIRDISEQIAINKEVLAGKERYKTMYNLFRLMADNMPDMLWAKDLDMKYTFVNKAICDKILMAKDTDEPIGKTVLFFKEREQKNQPNNTDWNSFGVTSQYTDKQVLLSKKPEQFDDYVIVDGKPFFMDVYKAPIINENGQIIGVVGSARDISKQKKIELEIINRDKLLSAISKATAILIQAENINDSLYESLGLIGKAISINRIYIYKSCLIPNKKVPNLNLIFEWMDDFALGLNIDRTPKNDNLDYIEADWYERLLKGKVLHGKSSDFSPSEIKLFESQKIKSVLIVPVFIDKDFWGFVGFDDCLMEREWTVAEEKLLNTASGTIVSAYIRKINQEELLIAKERAEESDRLKSAFLANISHEIRTPMNGILGFISLLQDPNLTNSERNEYINIVKEGGDRLLNTIHDIIDISLIEARQMSLEYSMFDINEMVLTLTSIYRAGAEAKNLVMNQPVLVSNDQTQIGTDKNKLFSILSNLINNAIKYTNNGYIEIGLQRNDSDLDFYVKDTGIGIPEQKRQAVFDRFVQADVSNSRLYEGSGLGLSIAKAFVEMLGGKIWFESEEHVGSTFYFQIPLSEPKAEDKF